MSLEAESLPFVASQQAGEGEQLGSDWGWGCPIRRGSPVLHGTGKEGAHSPSCLHTGPSHKGNELCLTVQPAGRQGWGSSWAAIWLVGFHSRYPLFPGLSECMEALCPHCQMLTVC